MKTILPLDSLIETPEKHKAFVDAVILKAENHIQSLGLIKGLFIRNMYAAVKAVRPGYVQHLVTVLSRDYIAEFAEMHESFRKSQTLPTERVKPFIDYIKTHKKEAEMHFWKVANAYAKTRQKTFIGKAYEASKSSIQAHLPIVFEVICAEIDRGTIVDSE